MLAFLALAGLVLAVIGADTTVTDAQDAAPIVDDASRSDPVLFDDAQPVATVDTARGEDQPLLAIAVGCAVPAAAPPAGGGCGSATWRGPPTS